MIKKLFKHSLLIVMLVLASCFCVVGFKTSSLKINPNIEAEVFASEMVDLEVQSSSGFVKGTVDGYGSYPVGSTVTLNATPTVGCEFVKWQIWNSSSSTYVDLTNPSGGLDISNPYSFVIDENTKVKAVFDYVEYDVNNQLPEYLEINTVDFEYDENRFSAEDLVVYPRAEKTNLNSGHFYYNDIVSLQFNVKADTHLKQLASKNFVLNKSVMLIAINESGEILYTETSTGKNSFTEKTLIADYDSYNYDVYDYVIVTNKLEDQKYISTKVEVKARVKADLNLNLVNQTELQILALSAKLNDGSGLDINNVVDCIVFDYGFYAKTTGAENEKMYYLIEDGSNFKFTLSDNLIYDYQYAVGSDTYDQNPMLGTFNGEAEIVFYFKKISYAITFKQVINGGTGVDADWLVFEDASLYPGESLVAEFNNTNKRVKLFDTNSTEIATKNIVENEVYGFKFVGFSTSDYIDVSLGEDKTTITHTIDLSSPSNATIYVVLEKIKYQIGFGVADSDGVYSEYFTSKFKNLPESKGYVRGDNISLTADAPTGYKKIGWIMVNGGNSYELEFSNFTFIPTSNNVVETYFYLKVEYITFSLALALDGFVDGTGENVAKIGLNVIKYFTLNGGKDRLTIHGTYYNHKSLDGILEEVVTNPTVDGKTLTFSSALGNLTINLGDSSEPTSLKFGSYAFTCKTVFQEDRPTEVNYYKFIRNDTEKRTGINSMAINETQPSREYSIKLTNVCVDDIIFASTYLTNENYKFAHYAKLETSVELGRIFASSFNNNSNVYLCGLNYTTDTTIIVTCAQKDKSIYLATSREFAYSVADIDCELSGSGSCSYTSGDIFKVVKADTGNIRVIITKSNITKGFSFSGFKIELYSGNVEEYALSNSSIVEGAESYVFTLTINTTYNDSTIIALFSEVDYTVKFDTMADIEVMDAENNNLISNNSLVLNWSTLNALPTLTVNSRYGYYIQNAYYCVDDDINRILTLVGTSNSQTNTTYLFNEDNFVNYVIALANADNEVTIYLIEDERTFTITLEYSMISNEQEEYVQYVSNAVTKFSYDAVILETSATYGIVGSKYIFHIIFEGIPYNSAITLEMMDSMLEGTYFSKWQTEDGVTSVSNILNFVLSEDTYLYACFNTISYGMNFNVLNGVHAENSGYANLLVNGLANSSFKIGDNVQLNIFENAGYAFVGMYYIKAGTRYDGDGITLMSQDEDKYVYSIEQFIPSTFLATSRDEQKEMSSNGIVVLYLVFQEKLFTITTTASINSGNNTTGIEIEEWIDKDNLKMLYFNNTSEKYEEKTADPDGNVYYNTNSLIEIRFNSSFKGIEFVRLTLGGTIYKVSKTGTTEIAGQEVTLLLDESKGNNYYILRFELNSNVLETVGTDANFNVTITYKIKSYKITFSTNSVNNSLLFYSYTIKMSMHVSGAYTVNSDPKSSKPVSFSGASYGTNITFVVDSTTSKDDFNKKYYFRYFYVVSDGQIVPFNIQDPSISGNSATNFSFEISEQFFDVDNTPFTVWDIIADNTKPTIYAYYEPKITFGEDFEYAEEYQGFVKNTTYNGKVQKLTSSIDAGVKNPDIIYATELGSIEITYTTGGGSSVEPKDANTYLVSIRINMISYSGKVIFKINKAKLEFQYSGVAITKEYDGTTNLTGENLTTIQSNFNLKGLQGTDVADIKLSNISGYYATHKVGNNIDITVVGLSLGTSLTANYYVDEGVNTSYTISRLGTITKKQLTIDRGLFTFENIVYKGGQDYTLKYSINGEIKFRESLPNDLNDECYIDLNILTIVLNDYSIGENKTVVINLSSALDGADKDNYYINDMTYSINIHPYQLVFEVENYGRFTITDFDELCIIPIDTSLSDFSVEIINSNNSKYPNMYGMIENIISRSEKVYSFYEFTIKTVKGNVRDIKDFKNAYITFTDVKDLTSVYNVSDEINKLSTNKNNNEIIIKIEEESGNTIGVFVDKSYFAIWRILLIVGLIILFLLIVVVCVIIYKKAAAKKRDDKIY